MCDTFCVRRPGGMLFAKSSDRPVDEPQVLRWFERRPPGAELRTTCAAVPDTGAHALLGSQATWMWGLEHGINEHRVAIGNEKVWTVDDPRSVPPALLGMDLVRLGLERGRSADAALEAITELLAEHGQGGSGEEHHDEPYWSSFLIVDPSGGWVVETSGRSWVAEAVSDGAAISNRLTLRRGWTRSSADVAPGSDWDDRRDPNAPTGIADHRLSSTRACVARGAAVTAAEAVAVLRDHGAGPWGAPDGHGPQDPQPAPAGVDAEWHGVTVCMHVRDYQCTTASMVAELPHDGAEPVRVWASLGTPCTSVLLPVGVLDRRAGGPVAVVPATLGDAGTWRSLAGLSRRVEAPGDEGVEALVAIRTALAPVEAAAWAEADELWGAGAGTDRWRRATAGWDATLRAALVSLADR